MSRAELDRELADLRGATEAIAPDDGFTDAVMASVARSRTARDPLGEVARATESLDAGDGFSDAVMERAASARPRAGRAPAWTDDVARSGPIAVGIALIAAAASFVIFLSSQGDVDATVASSVDAVEVIE